MGTLHNILYLRYPIHITHLCVAVELHSLNLAQILSCNSKISALFDTCHRADGQFPVKFINGCDPLDFNENALFKIPQQFRQLIISGEHLHRYRVGKVRDCKHQNRLVISDLPGIKINNLSVDGNLSHLSNNLIQCDRLIVEIPAVYQARVIALLKRPVEIFFLENLSSLKSPFFRSLPVFPDSPLSFLPGRQRCLLPVLRLSASPCVQIWH